MEDAEETEDDDEESDAMEEDDEEGSAMEEENESESDECASPSPERSSSRTSLATASATTPVLTSSRKIHRAKGLMQLATMADELPNGEYKCKKCTKTYAKLYRVVRHYETHTRPQPPPAPKPPKVVEKPKPRGRREVALPLLHTIADRLPDGGYRCKICSQVFDRTDRVKRHQSKHNELQKTFKCPEGRCSKAYTEAAELRRHQRDFHNLKTVKERDAKQPTKKRRYRCSKCPTMWVSPSDRRRHEKSHMGQGLPFGCVKCGLRVRTKEKLEFHLQSHEMAL